MPAADTIALGIMQILVDLVAILSTQAKRMAATAHLQRGQVFRTKLREGKWRQSVLQLGLL